MKSAKIIYWITTTLIVLFEGLLPGLTFNTALAIEGVRHLGYPDYFRIMLTAFKVIGAIALIMPAVKGNQKEWAYAGFGFTFISAGVSHWSVDGFNGQTIFPFAMLVLLAVSYRCYHKVYPAIG